MTALAIGPFSDVYEQENERGRNIWGLLYRQITIISNEIRIKIGYGYKR